MGDLRVGQTLVIREFDYFALGVAEGFQCVGCSTLLESLEDHVSGSGYRLPGRVQTDAMGSITGGLFAAHPVDGPPVGNRDGPRPRGGAIAIEPSGVLPDLDEDFLGHLLSLVRIAEDP